MADNKGKPVGGHDGPVHLDQKKPMPTQGNFVKTSAQKDVPFKSGAATKNKNVT